MTTSGLERPDWRLLGSNWPNRAASRFVKVRGLTFHVQRAGRGPTLLLLHGTGSSTHSWRDLFERLSRHHDVIAIDLPGHGFSGHPGYSRLSLPGVARDVGALLHELGAVVSGAIGHSAGAAIACRMVLDGRFRPDVIIGLNGALLPFDGVGRTLFPSLAKVLFVNPLTPRLFAWQARRRDVVKKLLEGTGSRVDEDMTNLYWALMKCPGHVDGALSMMANWDLAGLEADLPRLDVPLVLVAGENDRTVPPSVARRVASAVNGASHVCLNGLGHLAHEEAPDVIAEMVLERMRGVSHPSLIEPAGESLAGR